MSTSIDWVALPGGSFTMGSADFYPDEAPPHTTQVAPFEVARTPVTNAQFRRFVEETHYTTTAETPLSPEEFPQLTDAERSAGSLVFVPTEHAVPLSDWRQWWSWQEGASWRHPNGTDPLTAQHDTHPVVQISFLDAQAFAIWAGARLLTEEEHEFAALGGTDGTSPYAWGHTREPDGVVMANTWRGKFPYENWGSEGWHGTSPVGSFPENQYGLFDCIGNVWEWTSSIYTPSHSKRASSPTAPQHTPIAARQSCACSPASNPPTNLEEQATQNRVLKGGSHLCSSDYCLRYRPAARSPQEERSSTNHIGFRIARDLQ